MYVPGSLIKKKLKIKKKKRKKKKKLKKKKQKKKQHFPRVKNSKFFIVYVCY